MSSAESDSDEFYDATEDVTSPLRRKTSAQKQKSAVPAFTVYEQQLKLLEKERLEGEERRRQEDEAIKAQIRELEEKKQVEEEKERLRLLEEQKKREREREEEERRRQEEEEREKEQQEAELRRQEAEKRRRRLELMRRREEGDETNSDVDESKTVIPPAVSETTDLTYQSSSIVADNEQLNMVEKREPGLANRNVEPDVIASTKTKERPSELPVPAAKDDMPPPVAPPRRKKKKKPAEVKPLEPLETQNVQQKQQQQQEQQQKPQQQQEGDQVLEEDAEIPIGLPPEAITGTSGSSRPKSGLLTPTTTIESITKELEHTLDLASLTCGEYSSTVVLHRDTQSIKGESRADIEAQLAAEASGERVGSKSRGNTPDADKLLSYYNLMQGMSDKGEKLTDEEVLTQVLVKNLDTGETVPLLEAEEKLPRCINPLNLHIMRLTSEYVSNSSLEKEAGGGSDAEKDKDATAVVQQQIKKKKKKLKKFLGKTVRKIKDAAEEAFQHEEDFSDDESLPDSRVMKIKAASSNKGPYDFDQLKLAQELSGEHTGAVWTMKFSSCGRLLATAGQDHILRVWVLKDHYKYFDDMRQKYNNESTQPQPSAAPMQENKSDEMPSTEGADTESVESGATSVDSDEPSVFAKTPFCLYRGHTSDLLDVSWSKNYFILSSSMDKTVRLWHVSRNECLCCFQHIDFVTAIAFHPRDDRYFLSGSLDGKLRLWNIPDKKVALWNEIDGPTKLITAANFIQNGRFAVVGTYDGRCIFYDTEHLKYYSQIHVRSTRGRNAKGRKVTAIEPLPHQDKILVTSNDSRIRLYDLRDLSLSCKYKGCTNISSQIKASFSHNHRYIICGSEDHCIYIWKKDYDFAKFTSVRRDRNDYWEAIKAHDAVVTVAVCSPNPSLIIKPTVALTGPTKETPLEMAIKKDKLDPKMSEASKLERKSSLKRVLNQTEVVVSADFNGTIKIFVNRPKV